MARMPAPGALGGLTLVLGTAVYVAFARRVPSAVVYLSLPLWIPLGAMSCPSHWEPSFEIVDVPSGAEGAAEA